MGTPEFKYLKEPDRWPRGPARHPVGHFVQMDGEVQITHFGFIHANLEEFDYVSSTIRFTFHTYLIWVGDLPSHCAIHEPMFDYGIQAAWQKKHGGERCPSKIVEVVKQNIMQALPVRHEGWKLTFTDESPDRYKTQ